MKLIKVVLLLFLILLSVSVLADTYSVTKKYYANPKSSTLRPTPDDACSAYLTYADYLGASSSQFVVSSSGLDSFPSGTCRLKGSTGQLIQTVDIFYDWTCPYGGNVSGQSCVDAPSCPATYTRDAAGECQPPQALNCGANEYDNAGVCTPIPDCNADAPLGRNFFDVETKSCKTIEGVGTICIGDAAPKYCPPIDDCKPAGYICSNEPKQKAIEDAQRQSAIDAAAASAAEKKQQADDIASAAAAAAAGKAADAAAAKSALQAASDALAAAKASGDQAAIAAAAKDYAAALKSSQDAAARASNSQASSDRAQETNIDAGNEQAQIPSSNPGNAAAHDSAIGDMIPGLITALDDAISGDGAGTGRGSGVVTSTSETSIDTSGLATDLTSKGIESNTKGILDELKGGGNKGAFGSAPDSFYESEYPDGISGVWDSHKAALNQTSFVSAVSGLTPAIGGDSGSCPSWTLPPVPYLSSSSHEFQPPCEVWPVLRVIFIITALFTARSLIFGG
jgi:hypothetical protein